MFNLGKLYVTMCTYQNFKVINEHGKHPIMIGPTLIHSSKDQSNFSVLFQEVVERKPILASSLRAYGTDGEQALSNAAAHAFPFAIHLRCVNHLRDNITAHLHKQLLPEAMVKEILKDIFDTATEKGLIHSSEKEFGDKLLLLQKRWDLLEKCHNKSCTVFRWFKLHVAPIIRENVRSELIKDLGMIEEKYTQNNSESLNALVKRYVNFQKQDIFQFVDDLEECVQEQQNEVNKATIGLGRWSLSHYYTHIGEKTRNWFGSMSLAEKENALSSICSASAHLTGSSQGEVLPTVQDAEELPSENLNITLPYSLLSGTLSDGQLKAMWMKASRLMSEKKVIKAPDSNPKTRWVSSDSSSSPHVVKVNPRRYICDKQCVGWKNHNICAHCVAAAESSRSF